MGTSSSSYGPKSEIQFDPPWLDDLASSIIDPSQQPDENEEGQTTESDDPNVAIFAPPKRFRSARFYLGEYAKSRSKGSLKKALGSYSREGMGGASNVAKRMRVSTVVGARFFSFLNECQNGTNPRVVDWIRNLTISDLSIQEIAEEIINQVIPSTGSLDEESCRDSMSNAIAEFMGNDSNFDLLHMDNASIWKVVELFIANEAFNRITIDIGQLFEREKYSPYESVLALNDMKDYLQEEISAQIQALKKDNNNPSTKELNNLLQSAVRITFEIYEGEL